MSTAASAFWFRFRLLCLIKKNNPFPIIIQFVLRIRSASGAWDSASIFGTGVRTASGTLVLFRLTLLNYADDLGILSLVIRSHDLLPAGFVHQIQFGVGFRQWRWVSFPRRLLAPLPSPFSKKLANRNLNLLFKKLQVYFVGILFYWLHSHG